MTPDHEAAIRVAADALAAAILATVRAEATPAPDAPDRLLSLDQACAALSLGRSFLYDEITKGRLRTIKAGRRRLVPSAAIAAYIAQAAAR